MGQPGSGVAEKYVPRQPGVPPPNATGKKRRLERQLVRGADVFAHIVDAVAGANRRGVMAEEIVGQADARAEFVE